MKNNSKTCFYHFDRLGQSKLLLELKNEKKKTEISFIQKQFQFAIRFCLYFILFRQSCGNFTIHVFPLFPLHYYILNIVHCMREQSQND